MAATVKTILRKDKIRADGTCPIYVRITVNRRRKLIGTKIYVSAGDWNPEKQRVRRGHDLADSYNQRIIEIENEAKSEGLTASSADAIKRSLEKGKGRVVTDIEEYIVELTERSQESERKKYIVLRNKVVECFRGLLTWEQLDHRALNRFEKYMRSNRGNANNTIRNEMKRLRRLFKRALVAGDVRFDQDPFLAYKSLKQTQTEKRHLSKEEIRALSELELDQGTSVRIARDAFMFSYYGSGIRFGDLCALKQENLVGVRLIYRMMKTDRSVTVTLPDAAIELIGPYVAASGPYLFPFIKVDCKSDSVLLRKRISSRNVIVNRNLKKAALLAGINAEGLSMHIARHSFADMARRDSGDLHAISKALGHADLKTTEVYLENFDQDAADKLSSDLWS